MSDNKDLPPTAKKLRDARQRGEIAKSQEVVQMASLAAVLLYGWFAADQAMLAIARVFQLIDEIEPGRLRGDGLVWFIGEAASRSMVLFLILGVLPVAFGVFAGLMQTGWLVAVEPLAPKFERMNPVTNLKNMLTLTKLADVARRLLKSVLILWAVWWVCKAMLMSSSNALGQETSAITALIGGGLLRLSTMAAIVFLLGAVADSVLQRIQFMKQQRMSKDEVRRENKEMMGDPQIRGRRRALHREMAMSKMVQNARRAQVLVTNPTHVAIALSYDPDSPDVPVVSAKGLDALALQMRAAAREAGVPIYEDIPLARRLHAAVELDAPIGRELFEAVAHVLIWVEELRGAQATPEYTSDPGH